MRIRDSGIFLTLKPGSRMEKFGSEINIPDPYPYHSLKNGPVKYLFPIPYGIHLYYVKKILVVTRKYKKIIKRGKKAHLVQPRVRREHSPCP